MNPANFPCNFFADRVHIGCRLLDAALVELFVSNDLLVLRSRVDLAFGWSIKLQYFPKKNYTLIILSDIYVIA